MFVDSHAHLEMPNFDSDRETVIERARCAGIGEILNIGTYDPIQGSLERAFALADKFDFVYTSLGVHPHDAKSVTEDTYDELAQLASHPKVIGVGEIGLDYFYDNSPREVQRQVFSSQLELARKLGLPVIVHSRDAEEDTLKILHKESDATGQRGVMHCFSGSLQMAMECIEIGLLISFSGILTFKNADSLREVANKIPLDRILIETDSPFLAPIPYRGKRNEPAFVTEVANTIAKIKNIPVEEIGRITSANFANLFKRCES